MRRFNHPFSIPYLVMCVCMLNCNQKNADPELITVDLLRGDVLLCGSGKLGTVGSFLSCNATTKENFDMGIALLHSFEYEEAEKAFVKVMDQDPNCVMAYWGVAMSNFHSLWLQSGTDYLVKGSKILEIAHRLDKTQKEQEYLDAIGAFYKDWNTKDRKTRITLFEQHMEALYKKYNADTEVAIFYALALCAAADPGDKSFVNQKRAGQILESLYIENPDHPGIAHYIIHNYDYPELAVKALPIARRYAKIAPASAHAQHMPSHIFTRLGLWEEAIESNKNSTSSALCYAENNGIDGHWDEEMHGMDYLVYAYLQMGNTEKAKEQYEYLKTFKKVVPTNFKVAYAAVAIPSRIALETKNWKAASELQLPELPINWNEFPWETSIHHFTKGLGAVMLGNKYLAEKELRELEYRHQKLASNNEAYKSNQVQVQINILRSWLLYANGDEDRAITLMREATDMENKSGKHPVTPGEVLPAGELLGDLLMACHKPSEALDAYEANLKTHPNRFNGIYGAALASREMGNAFNAKSFFEILIQLTKESHSDRKEVHEAKEYVSQSL